MAGAKVPAIIVRRNGGHMNNNKVKNVDGMVGEGVGFERIRRITGYLVGTLDRFNDGKRAEVEDRVQHGFGGGSAQTRKEKKQDEPER
ncbi:MAG: hypothetical protein IJI87_09875 [Mogibacterium sp.]|nr:hypothetical protein [Mogibacterium sp.]